MNSKAIILFVLTAGILAAALVFDGVSHRRAANNGQTISQNAVATQPSSQPADASGLQTNVQPDAQTGTQTEVQQADPADPNAQASEPGQDATADDASQTQTDADAAADAQPAPQPIVVPAGTTLAVRLGEDLGSSTSTSGQNFSATLDRDVVVDGQTVIAAGASVTGRVVSARPAGALAGEAHLQLKLISVSVDNGKLRLATSVRSFGPKIKGKNKVGRFMKGLVKRAAGDEREVLLAQQSAYTFTLQQRLQIQ
jgi:pyruvate/2-oxoglutarate dehydrogenase complex dihydrolipoamide acyltransferase (E2) component